jgi:hypothetical protein
VRRKQYTCRPIVLLFVILLFAITRVAGGGGRSLFFNRTMLSLHYRTSAAPGCGHCAFKPDAIMCVGLSTDNGVSIVIALSSCRLYTKHKHTIKY